MRRLSRTCSARRSSDAVLIAAHVARTTATKTRHIRHSDKSDVPTPCAGHHAGKQHSGIMKQQHLQDKSALNALETQRATFL